MKVLNYHVVLPSASPEIEKQIDSIFSIAELNPNPTMEAGKARVQ
jgi:hypothetical protein